MHFKCLNHKYRLLKFYSLEYKDAFEYLSDIEVMEYIELVLTILESGVI
ncbi:MAG: hypothetical protein KIC66_11695 [Clostridium sp.]|nr:hypothetical protein [Clostridium sp.]